MVPVPSVDKPIEASDFAQVVGIALRDARRVRHMRRRHLADRSISVAQLRAVERGDYALTRPLLTELSSRYGVDLGTLFGERHPLRIMSHSICIGDDNEACDTYSLDSLLDAYLSLLSRVRASRAGTLNGSRPLRRDDIRVLAEHLGMPCTTVISRLAAIMNATASETRAMVELYLAGASVVGLQENQAS